MPDMQGVPEERSASDPPAEEIAGPWSKTKWGRRRCPRGFGGCYGLASVQSGPTQWLSTRLALGLHSSLARFLDGKATLRCVIIRSARTSCANSADHPRREKLVTNAIITLTTDYVLTTSRGTKRSDPQNQSGSTIVTSHMCDTFDLLDGALTIGAPTPTFPRKLFSG